MPKVPKFDDRIVARARVKYLGPENYQIICHDQGGLRFEEADCFESTFDDAVTRKRDMVNKSYSPFTR